MIEALSNQDESGVTVDRLREMAGHSPIPAASALDNETPPRFRVQRLSARLNSDQIASIVRRYEGGDSATAIAKSLDVAPSALIRLLRERGVVVRKEAVSTEQGKQMAREYDAGATMAELEKKYGLSHSVVYRALHRAGIEPRKTGRPSRGGGPPLVK